MVIGKWAWLIWLLGSTWCNSGDREMDGANLVSIKWEGHSGDWEGNVWVILVNWKLLEVILVIGKVWENSSDWEVIGTWVVHMVFGKWVGSLK